MSKKNKPNLIVIVGPTASGKTAASIAIARHLDAELISADSRQFYKEIPIGTAAPTTEDMDELRHHFVGHLSIEQSYNVSQYEQDVLYLLNDYFKSKNQMVMVGGSGLYIDAVCHGIDELPDPDLKVREELKLMLETQGIESLCEKLEKLDPEHFKIVDKQNPKRLMRAIEVCLQTGKTFTEQRLNKAKTRDFNIVKIGLMLPREILNIRIAKRTELMLKTGWLEEAKSVWHLRDLNALNTVGYKELFMYLDGIYSLEEAVEKIKTNTRRYAKRQMTWFKRDQSIHWVEPEKLASDLNYIEKLLQ